eukprot:gene3910-4881_t
MTTKGGLESKKIESIVFLLALFAFQCFMIVLFTIWVQYDNNNSEANKKEPIVVDGQTIIVPNPVQDKVDSYYGYFRDINIMIFFGFGFLMTFLRRYGYSALGYTFLVSAMVAQWSILVWGFFETVHHNHDFIGGHFDFGLTTMLNGLFCAGSVMISYGALLGKVTPLQMLVLGIIEPIFFFLNMFIGELKLEAIDNKDHPDNSPSYNGDLFAMAGTLFLWMMWPSFNAAIAPEGDPQFRAIANTFLSLTGSTIATFIVSRLLGHMGHKLDMVHVQNSTLAGGVVQGCLAHMDINPGGAIGMGFIAGVVSVLGYVFLTPFLNKRCGIQDTCGINNLHGMPGFIGCIATVIAAWRGNNGYGNYGSDYDAIFRAGENQARNNAAETFITIGIAVVGGLITGVILKFVGKIGKLRQEEYFNDNAFWHVPTDYPKDQESGNAQHHQNEGIEMDKAHHRHNNTEGTDV